jgi:hypothetical protein
MEGLLIENEQQDFLRHHLTKNLKGQDIVTNLTICLANELPLQFAAIPAFRPCSPSRCLALDYSVTLCCEIRAEVVEPNVVLEQILEYSSLFPHSGRRRNIGPPLVVLINILYLRRRIN